LDCDAFFETYEILPFGPIILTVSFSMVMRNYNSKPKFQHYWKAI
jgi:hypothetical protein